MVSEDKKLTFKIFLVLCEGQNRFHSLIILKGNGRRNEDWPELQLERRGRIVNFGDKRP